MHPAVERATDSDEPRTRCWLGLRRIVRAAPRRRNRAATVANAPADVSFSHERARPRAGQPAEPADLVDVDALLRAYYELRPDPSDPGPAGRLRDVRPPRLGVQGRVQRGPHPRHDRGHLPLPRPRRATAARCSSAATRTPCPSPPGGRRSRCWRRTGSTSGSTPTTGSRRRPRCRTRSSSRTAADVRRRRPRRRHRRHAVAQPARGRRLQVQPAQRRPGRHRRHALDPGRGEPDPRGVGRRRPRRHRARAVRAGTGATPGEYDFRDAYVADLGNVVDMAAIAASGLRIGVDPLGGAAVDYWGGDRGALRARPDRHQRQRSTRRSGS